MRKVRIVNWNDEAYIRNIIKQSRSFSDVCRTMEITVTSGNYRTLKKYIKKYEISINHFSVNYARMVENNRSKNLPNNVVFVKNSTYARHHLKRRIIEQKLIPYECMNCNNDGVWNGSQLTLQLEHKNGVNNDDRIENLCFMCPNCHSQTGTYAGKKKNGSLV